MARIYERDGKKGRYWYLDYAVDGRRVRKRVGKSKRLAELALADVQVKLERKELGFTAKDRALDDFLREYLAYSKGNKAPQSYARDIRILKLFTEFLQVDRLSAVTAARLEAYKAHRREQGNKVSTINRELNTIKAMLNKAVAWGALPQDPAKSVQKFREPRRQVRYLSTEEARTAIKAADERLRPILETFLHTGLRRDELIHLTWADIDFKNKVVAIQSKDGWNPKDYETRHIPMTSRLREVLDALPRREDSPLFTNVGGRQLDGNVLSRDFRLLFRRCGIENASVHTLRHTFASHLVMNGTDIYTVQKLLGHSTIKTTEIYAHLAPDFLRSAMDKLRY
ncbi:MAG: tyrosine-type recombinase/integrase [Elusimicrobiota bacterium]|jgi:site-specific recombinase XerD